MASMEVGVILVIAKRHDIVVLVGGKGDGASDGKGFALRWGGGRGRRRDSTCAARVELTHLFYY